jgi:hypothetical protein
MRAALCIQGPNNVVDGVRIAQPDWNYIASGRVTPATAITSAYAAESSVENLGVYMFGGWGCKVQNSTVWGSDAFGGPGVRIELAMLDTVSQPSSLTEIRDNLIYGQYKSAEIIFNGGLFDGGLSYPARFTPASGARAYIRYNRLTGTRWGDTAATPVINNSINHAGHTTITGIWLNGEAAIYGNDVSGDCQDACEIIGVNMLVAENYIHDILPGYPGSTTYTYWYNNAGTWATTTALPIGQGIKLGLSGYDGFANSTPWPSLGSLASASNLYQVAGLRNRAHRNRIAGQPCTNNNPAISNNAANGCIITANEITDWDYGISVNRGGRAIGEVLETFVANNYIGGRRVGFNPSTYHEIYLYNNIIVGPPSGSFGDIVCGGAGVNLRGSNNRIVNNRVTLNGATNLMTGNTTGSADYTLGVGPTLGGNCANSGSWNGLYGARASSALLNFLGHSWGNSVPVGPRK